MEQKEKKLSGGRLEWLFVLLIVGVLLLVSVSFKKSTSASNTDELLSLKEGWYYLDQGEPVMVELPLTFEWEEETLTLYYDNLGEKDGGKMITTRGASNEVKMEVDGQVLYEYSDEQFPRNDQMKAKLDCCGVLPGNMQGKTLKLLFRTVPGQTCYINEVLIGTGNAVTNYHYKNAAFSMVLVLVMAFLAMVSFGVAVYLRLVKMKDCRFANMACFLLLCGIWCTTDSSIMQHWTRLSPITCVISFYAFMLLAIPLIHFLRNTKGLGEYRIWDWLQAAFYINAAAQGLFNYFGVFEFIEMLFVTHLLLLGSATGAAWILIREFRKKRERELYIILCAFVELVMGGVLALLLYWLLEIPYYGLIFECGILVFVLLLLFGIMISITDNVRYKTEMLVYQRLAKEDRLTGMKNRLAFEEYLTELQSKAASFENVALVFMDLNQLKIINDCHGHNAGDELLIAAARCIQNTFGVEGNCYRIGGDEFCVIIENPEKTEQEWFDRLDNEIRVYNTNGRYRMSIARGLSYLKDDAGVMKTMSDWKYEADLKMYENKGRMIRI